MKNLRPMPDIDRQQAIENRTFAGFTPDNPVSLQKIETMIKMMTCKQLGGACDLEFKAETFEEIAALSRAHAQKMIQQKDKAHGEAMQKMQQLMKSPDSMKIWMENKRRAFDAL